MSCKPISLLLGLLGPNSVASLWDGKGAVPALCKPQVPGQCPESCPPMYAQWCKANGKEAQEGPHLLCLSALVMSLAETRWPS